MAEFTSSSARAIGGDDLVEDAASDLARIASPRLFVCLLLAAACAAIASGVVWLFQWTNPGPWLCAAVVLLALSLGGFQSTRGLRYTAWILAAVIIPLNYPRPFVRIGSLELTDLIVPVIMLIMFAMGTQMSLADFRGVIRMPKAVGVGLFAQYTVMPLTGAALASAFHLPVEIATGVILIGSCSSGLASTVMAYLANANVALSITLTIVGTIMAPLVTPFWMTVLADESVLVSAPKMMIDILELTVLPVVGGLVYNRFFHGRWRRVDAAMPLLAMSGIIYYTTVTTAIGREALLQVGGLLVITAVLHNLIGYLLGYWFARLVRLDERSCRTVALEVGMQNGGMAVGLAKQMNRLATVGLASIVFSPWMNVSGSILANYWRNRPVDDSEST